VVLVTVAPLVVLSTRQSDQVSWIGRPGAGALAGFAGTTAFALVCAAMCRNTTSRVLRGVRLPVLALGLLVLPALLLLLVSLVTPLYVDRYVLYGQSGTALLTGAALARLTRARRTRAAALTCAGAAVLALLPVTLHLRTPQSRVDDVGAIARAVAEAGAPGDGVLYLPARRRVWSLPDPGSVRGLRDLALDRAPAASHTLYGSEVPAPVIRARMITATRIVAVSDPAGQPLDATPGEIVKRRVLATYFEKCGTRRVQGARVTVYARPGTC
jgi:mannosyltransferase